MKELQLEIITPDAEVFAGEVTKVTVPGAEGSFQVLFNHAPIISTLTEGQVKFEDTEGKTHYYHAEGGVVEVLKNKVILLAEKIQKQNDLN